ncbi:uncharacterized protein METZ01_LOCUS456810 [marine metagenome]|uniref:Uncharacterized protein n=1 Tax=marine metagenome TaxID=408172 RepID=A0A383A7V4_9ZZZZ
MNYDEYKLEQITMLLGAILISNLAIAWCFFRGMNL